MEALYLFLWCGLVLVTSKRGMRTRTVHRASLAQVGRCSSAANDNTPDRGLSGGPARSHKLSRKRIHAV
jgi:hypothetical protein